MCNFFSLISDPKLGKIFYFDAILRRKIKVEQLDYNPDSHTSIATHFGYKSDKEDCLNKYEYNPLTRKFTIDQLNGLDDSEIVKDFCDKLDFSTIVPELVVKPIINPFKIKQHKVTKKDITNLNKWISAWDSVGDSVWNSVGISVGNSVGNSVWDSVWNSVENSVQNSVWDSVWNSVGDSVGDSVQNSVQNSVWNSVCAYMSSFFNTKYDHDFTCLNELWNRGFVPSFDGTTWRLHSGERAEIVCEVKG
jgi:hypothetical protein